ncbi:unnamed protein product [Pleuronectes platessa]|uniref:Uncharacterized protein n=1 Tax=Pleuronectes platessa TaxID=8262 RepID=A0A9N7TTR9_PLEPL|nr:unnamed protein product [Pleuronectes platessa]
MLLWCGLRWKVWCSGRTLGSYLLSLMPLVLSDNVLSADNKPRWSNRSPPRRCPSRGTWSDSFAPCVEPEDSLHEGHTVSTVHRVQRVHAPVLPLDAGAGEEPQSNLRSDPPGSVAILLSDWLRATSVTECLWRGASLAFNEGAVLISITSDLMTISLGLLSPSASFSTGLH